MNEEERANQPEPIEDPNRFRLTPEEWQRVVKGAKEDLEVIRRFEATQRTKKKKSTKRQLRKGGESPQ